MDNNNLKVQEKYNLFVTSEEGAWESDSYIMPIDRCLTSFTPPEIREEYKLSNKAALDKLLQLPCIFAYEDFHKHNAYIGYITDITVRSSGVKIKYNKLSELSFDILHKLTFELDINMSISITELMHTHWTVKNVNLFKELGGIEEPISEVIKPTVFISYAWSPKENKDKVLELANQLEKDGVNVRFDKKCLLPGQDMNMFMESLATDPTIKKVLVICNSVYASKADSRQGGVGTESEIIIPQVYGNPMQNKIIPVFFEKDSNGNYFCPIYLRSRLGIDFTVAYEDGYKDLLEDIFR